MPCSMSPMVAAPPSAHLKAALLDQAGKVLAVYQQPCQLWKGLDQLQSAVKAILQQVTLLYIPGILKNKVFLGYFKRSILLYRLAIEAF